MAQPQQQTQLPPRAFSPPNPTPSPAAQTSFALPPNKRVRTDGPSSQPGSPYATSPYAASPVAAGTPPTTAASPAYVQTPALPGPYATPYTNGHTAPSLNLPSAQPTPTPPIQAPLHIPMPTPQYTNATMTPLPTTAATSTPGPMVMGPPQKPAERPTKDYEYDVTDSLAGTGIDLRAEEQYMSELYSTGFDASNTEARTGFPQHPPGTKATFFGAGIANQPAQATGDASQQQFAAAQAEKAWKESSLRLAVQRTQEIGDPFLLVAMIHRRADKIAREHHISLNLDLKNTQTMGKMRLPEQFPQPRVSVRTNSGPDSTIVSTTGSYIPHDAFLADQLALLSIATKHRLRELVEDANLVTVNRQKTSHGDVPEDWAKASAPMNSEPLEPIEDAADGTGAEGATAPSTSPSKRSAETAFGGRPGPSKLPKISSYMTATMRELARQERDWEEARLRKRQRRKDGIPDSGPTGTTSRAGSVAPGTPGSVAPEPEKVLTKKEIKKSQAMKAAEANSHANQNMTSSMFAGLGGKSGLFGKKKAKTYDWMRSGGGSGSSTPTRNAPSGGKGLGSGGATAGPANLALTSEGRNRLGTWREDKEKGRNIQLRDWITVLERDGREPKALQRAYIMLDASNPK